MIKVLTLFNLGSKESIVSALILKLILHSSKLHKSLKYYQNTIPYTRTIISDNIKIFIIVSKV